LISLDDSYIGLSSTSPCDVIFNEKILPKTSDKLKKTLLASISVAAV